ncbi:unnamed protein product [Enterobius vermicularis]|uniref:Cyclin N-terminal domain-containing protein n=1 Tax=Enterobius vermicularis TaxID=51028 RepID=A0A0N4UY94_ENTVE|nr:unnamed protein product [Enterobius vermicularis]
MVKVWSGFINFLYRYSAVSTSRLSETEEDGLEPGFRNVTHHFTRASVKAALEEQTGVVTRRTALLDHRNILPARANQQELTKKGDLKKVVHPPAAKKTEKENAKEEVGKKRVSLTQSRFDAVVLHCEEYKDDVEDYVFQLEKRFGVKPEFLFGLEITPKMRSILVDWLIQVHLRFHLLPETLFLAINILDRYLAKGLATKNLLQLIGVASLSAAAKYEEIFPPEILDYVFITENSVSRLDVIRMEYKILSALDVDLGRPTIIQFVRRISTYFNPRVHIMAKYVSENMVVDYRTCHLNPSMIAAVSVWLAAALENCSFPAVLYNRARLVIEIFIDIITG